MRNANSSNAYPQLTTKPIERCCMVGSYPMPRPEIEVLGFLDTAQPEHLPMMLSE
jgi:hypothetical protein